MNQKRKQNQQQQKQEQKQNNLEVQSKLEYQSHQKQQKNNYRHRLKYIIYIISIISSASLVGLIGTYAIVKKYLAEQMHLTEGFLGLLDSLQFVGRIIGFIFMTIYPTKMPKRDYFINSILTTIFLLLIPLASIQYFSQIPQYQTFAQSQLYPSTTSLIMLIIGMILSGISRAYVLIPYLIILQYFNVHDHDDRVYINYFASLGTMGDVIAIIVTSFMIKIGFSWQFCFCFSLSVFLGCGIALFWVADQVKMGKQDKNKSKQIKQVIKDKYDGNNKNQKDKQSTMQNISKNFTIIYNFYSKPDNFFWMLQYSFISILYYNILMWFPYFFMKLGFQLQSSTISIMYPIFCLVSVFLFTSVFRKKKPNNTQHSNLYNKFQHYLISLSHLLNTSFYLIMLFKNPAQTSSLIYIILVALSGITQGGPYSQITSSELRLRTTNNQQTFLAITTCKLLFQVITVVFMLVIGLLMQYNLQSFLWVIVGNTFCTFAVHTWRIVKYGNILTDHHNIQGGNKGIQGNQGKNRKSLSKKQKQQGEDEYEGSIQLVDLRSDSRVNGMQMDIQRRLSHQQLQKNHKIQDNSAQDSIKQTLLQKNTKN